MAVSVKTVQYMMDDAQEIVDEEGTEPEVRPAFTTAGVDGEIALNSHSEVSVATATGLVVNFANFPMVKEASYVIYAATEVSGAESTTLEKGEVLAEGTLSVSTYGVAEFEDIFFFEKGLKYILVVNVKDGADEASSYEFVFNGAYAEEFFSEVSVICDAEAEGITLNTHSAVSVDMANALKVAFGNPIEVKAAKYAICELVEVAGAESTTWEVGEIVASGDLSVSGFGYVAFEDAIFFEQGKKYGVQIIATTMTDEEVKSDVYEINGAYSDAVISEVSFTAQGEEDEIVLNSHAVVSVEYANGIKAAFGTPMLIGSASYVISRLEENVGAESSTWVVAETVAKGDFSINTVGFAEFEEAIYFEQGEKYQVVVEAKDMDGVVLATETYEFNGAYAAEAISEVSLVAADETEVTLNSHSTVSVESAAAVKVAFGSPMAVASATYAICTMVEEATEEATSWVPGTEVAKGEFSINTIGYAAFEEAINFNQGEKYMIVVEATGFDGSVLGTVTYEFDGAYVEPVIAAASFIAQGEAEDIVLNSHAVVSVERANSLKVAFGNPMTVGSATYKVAKMVEEIGEESTSWVLGEVISEGELSINTFAYVEFGDGLVFDYGTKYAVVIVVNDRDGVELANETYEFNGATNAPAIASVSFVSVEDDIELNSHSAVSVETANSIKVQFGNPSKVGSATYTINEMVPVVGDESTTWEVGQVVATGDLAIKTLGYAEFEDGLCFEQGMKYQVTVVAKDREGAEMGTETYQFDGAYVAPVIAAATFTAVEEEITLNDHSAVSVPSANSLTVEFGTPVAVASATYSIYSLVAVENGDSYTWEIGGTVAEGDLSINTIGYVAFAEPLTFSFGEKYMLVVKATGFDGSELGTAEYEFNGASEIPAIASASIVNGNGYIEVALNSHSAVSLEAADAISVKFGNPVAVAAATYVINEVEPNTTIVKSEVKNGNLSINTVGYADLQEGGYTVFEYGKQYQIVITACDRENNVLGTATFVINGACENVTAINGVATEAVKNGKFLENGAVVIVKNGVKYSVSGAIIK